MEPPRRRYAGAGAGLRASGARAGKGLGGPSRREEPTAARSGPPPQPAVPSALRRPWAGLPCRLAGAAPPVPARCRAPERQCAPGAGIASPPVPPALANPEQRPGRRGGLPWYPAHPMSTSAFPRGKRSPKPTECTPGGTGRALTTAVRPRAARRMALGGARGVPGRVGSRHCVSGLLTPLSGQAKAPSVWLSCRALSTPAAHTVTPFSGSSLLRTTLRPTGRKSPACVPRLPHAVITHVLARSASVGRVMPSWAWRATLHLRWCACTWCPGDGWHACSRFSSPWARTVRGHTAPHGRKAVTIELRVLRASTDPTRDAEGDERDP